MLGAMDQTTASAPGVPPTPAPQPTPRPFRRLPDEGPLGGVCAGIAHYFGIDPGIVRIAAVVLALSGPGAVAYVIAWIFVPAARPEEAAGVVVPERGRVGTQAVGIVLVALALSFLWGDWWSPARRWLFPFVLIAVGLWLVLHPTRSGSEASGAPADGDTSPGTGEDRGGHGTSGWTTPGAAQGLSHAPSAAAAPAEAGDGGAVPPVPPTTPVPPTPPVPSGPTPEERAARRRGRLLASVTIGALLVWGGIAALAGVAIETGLAVSLAIVGVGVVVGAVVGGAKLLIAPAVLLGVALLGVSLIDVPLRGAVGERTWVPSSVEDIDGPYRMAMGEGVLDLTELQAEPGEVIHIEMSVALGALEVRIPAEAGLTIDADVQGGETIILGRKDNGYRVDVNRTIAPATEDAPIFDLDIEAGFGKVEVIAVR